MPDSARQPKLRPGTHYLNKPGPYREIFPKILSATEVRAADSQSSEEYARFEGFSMTAKVANTVRRGEPVFADGEIVGKPRGHFVKRS